MIDLMQRWRETRYALSYGTYSLIWAFPGDTVVDRNTFRLRGR